MKQPTVLVVDDELESIQIVLKCFEQQNAPYEFVIATSCNMALKLAAQVIPTLIIIDWEMPEMTGIEIIKTIRQDGNLCHIPVVMLTGRMTSMENLKEALDAGAIDFVRKPFDDIELTSRVQAAIRFAGVIEEDRSKQQEITENEKQIVELKGRELTLELENHRREMLTTAMHLKQLTEINEKNIVLLNELYPHTKKEGYSVLSKLISSYKSQINQHNWNAFETRFNRIHENYNLKLRNDFPELTNADIRLCAFLRLNMSSKDIAALTFQKEQSINQARTRIRKKIGLKYEDNLVDFLSAF